MLFYICKILRLFNVIEKKILIENDKIKTGKFVKEYKVDSEEK